MFYFIYKIIDTNNEEQFYIGSTNCISSRKSQHKKNVKNRVSKKYWFKLYQYIRANGGWESFNVIIIETGECEDKLFIKQKEQEYINIHKPTLNTIKANKIINIINK